jgi:hypothetical protein
MTDENGALVSVMVPRKHLAAVYGLIATLENPASGSGEAPTSPTAEAEDEWTEDLIRRQYLESPPTIKEFQQLLARNPGQWLSTSNIADELNAANGSKTIAGALGAYGRRTTNRYKMTSWPFENRWIHDEGQQSYCMNPEIAKLIRGL